MTRFYDLDEANARIPEVRTILESLRDQRSELIRLRDEVLAHDAADAADEARGEARSDAPTEAKIDNDVRVLRLRMQGVIDRMQAGVVRIDELGIDRETVVIGTAGWLSPDEGHASLLRTARLILRQLPATKFLVVGAGPNDGELAATVQDDVCLMPRDRVDISDPMAAVDLFVVPSFHDEEMPTAILEAMALGKPVPSPDARPLHQSGALCRVREPEPGRP